jgi:alginate O-acetyltransferase complex protein AlgI
LWSKWHISLSTWVRDYLYIPLGGNRVSKFMRFRNIFIVFMISGLWHGASWTFIVWGALHGVYQVITLMLKPFTQKTEEKLNIQNSAVLRVGKILLTFCLVTFAWIFFRANNMHDAMTLIRGLKTTGQPLFMGNGVNQLAHSTLAILVLFAAEYVMEYKPHFTLYRHKLPAVRWASVLATIFIILLFGVFNGGQFIYFQF